MAEILRIASHGLRGEFKHDEPMAKHISWRCGGTADRAYFPTDLDDLRVFLATIPQDERLHVIGLGSNTLVRDSGIRGTVVFTHFALKRIEFTHDGLLYAEAGVASPKVARYAATHGFEGAEFLAGIPGTVGGALAMNAGCYGSETWERVKKVITLDRHGEKRERDPGDYLISYRHCELMPGARCTVPQRQEWFAGAWFEFTKGNGDAARVRIKDFLSGRIATQPLQLPNAGSVFRNPPGDYAARLIEASGLKGFRVGGAMVSPKHANFIVNAGGAVAADIELIIKHVRETVLRAQGVLLEPEVRVIGEHA